MRPYRRIPQEQIDKFVDLYRSGLSLREIGKITGFDHSNIAYSLKRKGIERRSRSDAIKISELKRDKHGENNPNWKDGRSNNAVYKIKLTTYAGGKCVDCNLVAKIDNYPVFEFHHLDPSNKDFAIAEKDNLKKTDKEVFAEIDKCVLLCANCHRLRHHLE